MISYPFPDQLKRSTRIVLSNDILVKPHRAALPVIFMESHLRHFLDGGNLNDVVTIEEVLKDVAARTKRDRRKK
eukprot:gene2983-biopygen11782